MLIAARGLLGVAGATLMPSTLSLIRVMFADPRQRTTAIGIWTASFALGGVVDDRRGVAVGRGTEPPRLVHGLAVDLAQLRHPPAGRAAG